MDKLFFPSILPNIMRHVILKIMIVCIGVMVIQTTALADIKQEVISGGSERSSAGNVVIYGTLGQSSPVGSLTTGVSGFNLSSGDIMFATTGAVITASVSSTTSTTAISGGDVTTDGGAFITAKGICWSTSANPTINDTYTVDGSDTGTFESSLTGLAPGTTYYARAYATNAEGTTYGNQIELTTTVPAITVGSVSDFGTLSVFSTSSEQSYVVSGSDLITDIALTAPSGYEISTTSGSGFSSTLTLTQSDGTVSDTTIYVRFSPTDVQNYSGNISHQSTSATAQTVALTGEGIKADQTITFGSLADKTYGDASFDLSASVNSGLSVAYVSSNTNVATISGTTVTIVGAGTATITASQDGNTLYNPAADVEQALTVNKKSLIVTADDKTRGYGEKDPIFSFQYSGFAGSDDKYDIDTLPSAVTDATIQSPPGAYTITPEGASDTSYTFVYNTGVLTIEASLDQARATIANYPTGLTNVTQYNVKIGGVGVVNYKYKVNDNGWSDSVAVENLLTFTVSGDRDYTLYVIGQDALETWQPEDIATTCTWVVDSTPPSAVIQNAPQGTVGTDQVNAVVQGTDVKYYKYRFDGDDWSVATRIDFSIQATDLETGSHQLDVIGMDTAGNWQNIGDATSVSWVIDLSVPTAELSNTPDKLTNSASAAIDVAGENITGYKYKISGPSDAYDGSWSEEVDIDTPISFSVFDDGTEDGTYTLLVNAVNEVGTWQDGGDGETDTNATQYTWVVDTAVPDAISTLAALNGDPSATVIDLSWSPDEENLKRYRIWFAPFELSESNLDSATELFCDIEPGVPGYNERFTVKGLSPGTRYYFALKTIDKANNVSMLGNVVSQVTSSMLPTIANLGLTSGGGASGTNDSARELTLTGTNYLSSVGDNIVRFVSLTRVFDVTTKAGTSTTIKVNVPVGAPVGRYQLRVINKNGSSKLSSQYYTVSQALVPLPEVTDLTPIIGRNDENTTLTIFGENFDPGVTLVTLADADGASLDSLTNVQRISSTKISAVVPSGISKGQYSIQVHNPNGDYNLVSSVEFEVSQPVDLSTTTGATTTNEIVIAPNDGIVPVSTILVTDNRPEVDIVSDNNMEIKAFVEPGTNLTEEDGITPYTETINPPRQVPMTEAMAKAIVEILNSDPSQSVVFKMGNEQKGIKFANGQYVFVEIDVTMESGAGEPLVYYVEADNSLELAGINGVKGDQTFKPGGTILSIKTDTPQVGYTTYSIGLLLDHMSTFLVSSYVAINLPPTPPSQPEVSGNQDYGPCFIDYIGDTGCRIFLKYWFHLIFLCSIVFFLHIRRVGKKGRKTFLIISMFIFLIIIGTNSIGYAEDGNVSDPIETMIDASSSIQEEALVPEENTEVQVGSDSQIIETDLQSSEDGVQPSISETSTEPDKQNDETEVQPSPSGRADENENPELSGEKRSSAHTTNRLKVKIFSNDYWENLQAGVGLRYEHINESFKASYNNTTSEFKMDNSIELFGRLGYMVNEDILIETDMAFDIYSGDFDRLNEISFSSINGFTFRTGPAYCFKGMYLKYLGEVRPFVKSVLGYKIISSDIDYPVKTFDPALGFELSAGLKKNNIDFNIGYSYFKHKRGSTFAGVNLDKTSDELSVSGIFLEVSYSWPGMN